MKRASNEARKGRHALQRLFSTFPGGPPGVGLLLLRAAVGFTALCSGSLYLLSPYMSLASKWGLGLALALGGAALLVGFLTPVTGVVLGLCFLGIGLAKFPAPLAAFHDTELMAFGLVITAVAIILLGPGAFSVDGYLFGRREIVIPPSSRHPEA